MSKLRRSRTRRLGSRDHNNLRPSAVESALERLGTPSDVLAHHGVQVRGRMARCPLHDDSSPSLSLYCRDGKERWRCHGCDQGGDALDLEAALSGRTVRDLLT